MDKFCKIYKIIDDLLESKLELMNQLYDLTILQYKKIEEDNIEKLLNIINSKQIRIEKINNIDSKYYSILQKNEVKKLSELDSNNDLYLNLMKKEDTTKVLVEKIYKMDQNNQHMLREKFELMREKIKALKKGKKVTSSYYQIPTQIEGYFIDNRK